MTTCNSVIEKIRQELELLSWLEKSYGRAYLHQEKRVDGKVVKLPKCFDGADYVNVLPNDSYDSMSFICSRGPVKFDSFNRDASNLKNRELSVIFWGNLTKIDSENPEIYTDDLIKDVETVLLTIPEVTKITQVYDEKVDDIFNGFTVSDVDTQYLMYPYAGFRIDFTINYLEAICE